MILIYTAGMALSVATGSNFIVLLIAITFHQTFEGLALGSRIASLTVFSTNSYKPWLMCLAYGTTTPIGQAIGLATRKLYDPASQQGLLMVGVMNAISSGLLLFAGLVELLAEDFLSDESYLVLKGRRRVQAGVAVVAGALGMALIGAWVSFLIIGLWEWGEGWLTGVGLMCNLANGLGGGKIIEEGTFLGGFFSLGFFLFTYFISNCNFYYHSMGAWLLRFFHIWLM